MERIIPDVCVCVWGGCWLQFKGKNEGEDGDGKPSWCYPPGPEQTAEIRQVWSLSNIQHFHFLQQQTGKKKEKDFRTFMWMESILAGSDQNLRRFFNSESESKSACEVEPGVRLKPDLWIN